MLKVHTLEIAYEIAQNLDFIYPTLLECESELFLVDCGYAGFMPKIEKSANIMGLNLANLTGLILTHHDIDHVAAASEIKQAYPQIKIYASAIEASFISGQTKSPRLRQAEALLLTLPPEQKAWGEEFVASLEAIKPVAIDELLPEDADFAVLPDLQIIATPGHTPGHISLYSPANKILLAADALVIENEQLRLANPEYILDLSQAIESVKKLQNLAIETVICYHGGIMQGNIAQQLSNLLADFA
ncbi:MAG: MBL fold metallo-hydrolase [Microscillaceae bacterium]|jgi:glyoxylase-like metal-dependent hydrolase (beta-lactamase superfamily II)|nr:MBL fold metallo-hydrolase [Microscillaceae bacterium]